MRAMSDAEVNIERYINCSINQSSANEKALVNKTDCEN